MGNGERPPWNLIIGAVLLLIALLALIWFLNTLRGGDNGDTTPTPTSESIIDPGSTVAPDESTPALDFPSEQDADDPTPTPTQATRTGDNQRVNPDEGTPEDENDTGVDLDSIELGPIAQQCPDRCLVRVAADNGLDGLLSTAETRASFRSGGWAWTIATTPGIAWLEQHVETVFVADSADTLSLYVAIVPSEELSSDRPNQIGTVIDSVGNLRLIRTDRVPANVRPLTDWGYEVHKVAPAPPPEISLPEEPVQLANIEIGALIEDVSGAAIESDIQSLQAMGTDEEGGLGTRYYTTAGNSQAAEFLYTRLESWGLRVWYQDFMSWEGYLMVNVIAEIPGDDESAIYGVMAHFDSIADDTNLAPGGDDNATGVSGTLEIARILSGYRLHHPVHFIFVNVEEVGIVGSQQFAKHAQDTGVPYEGVFNLDSIGAQRQYGYMVVNGNGSTAWMTELLRQINEAYGLGQVINVQNNEEIVADDNRLRDHGIDSIMIARELYGQSPTHHTSNDVLSTVWIDGVVRCTQVTLLSLASLVQG